MEETNLIESARKGDRAALTRLLLAHRDLVAGVVCRTVYDADSYKDVIQSVFCKAVVFIGSFRGGCRFSTWLYRIAINEAIEHNRRKMHWDKIDDALAKEQPLFPLPEAPDELEKISRKEITHAINGALNEISLDKKTAFFLFYMGGYSGRDGAAQMKISRDSFFMKLKAARDHVRQTLIKRGWSNG